MTMSIANPQSRVDRQKTYMLAWSVVVPISQTGPSQLVRRLVDSRVDPCDICSSDTPFARNVDRVQDILSL